MISAWWMLFLLLAFVIGYAWGGAKSWLKWRKSMHNLAYRVQVLLQANNTDRALKLLRLAQGIEEPAQKIKFDTALKDLEGGSND